MIPGLLAVFILMMKHSPLVPATLSVTSMMGYKTRIVLVLLISTIIGKIIQAGVLLIVKFLIWTVANAKTAFETPNVPKVSNDKTESEKTVEKTTSLAEPKENSAGAAQVSPEILPPEAASEEKSARPTQDGPKQPEKLTPEQETNRQFFTAMVLGTVLAKDGSAFDKWDSHRANVGLGLNCGCVLLVASFYPGDGLRAYEFLGGLMLVLSCIIQGRTLNQLKIEALGSALGQFIAAHNVEENKEIVLAVAKVLPVVMKHINPTESEKEPAQIVTEIAEKSKSPPVNNPNSQQRQKKRKR